MKILANIVKSTVIGGFFIVLPLLLVYVILEEILEAVVGLAAPIADLFPAGTFDDAKEPVALALALILIASVLFGIAAKLPIARRLGRWLEENTLGHLPLYRTLKSLTARFAKLEDGELFKPALVSSPDGQRELAYLMDDLGDGYAVVMLPRAPTPMVGSIKLVPMEQVEVLNVTLGDLTEVVSHWGAGCRELIENARSSRLTHDN